MKGPVEKAMKELNLSCGNFIRTCCHPLRTYENFSQKVLNVNETLATQPEKPYNLKGDAFLLEFKVEYQGRLCVVTRDVAVAVCGMFLMRKCSTKHL